MRNDCFVFRFYKARGCPAAALRIWTAPDTDQAPVELCGDKSSGEVWHYVSTGQSARISFITTDKTIGAQVDYFAQALELFDCDFSLK